MAHDARFRRSTLSLVVLGLASLARPAFAQAARAPEASQSATNSEATPIAEDTSYSGTVALVYGIGYAGVGAGYFMTRSERPYGVRIAGAIVLPSAVITTVFGPMLVHFDHGSMGKGLLSAGGQVVAVALGVVAGYGAASIAGAEEPGTAMLLGGLSAHAGWAVFDTLVLARDEQVVDRTIPAPTYTLSVEPGAGRGLGMRVGFRF